MSKLSLAVIWLLPVLAISIIVYIAGNDSRRRHLDDVKQQVATVYINEESSVTNG
ncbi:hypothetical protein MKX03_004123, partial [Papaver bracteatum]